MADFPLPFNDRIISYTAVGGETSYETDFPVYDEGDFQVIRTRAAVTTTLTITTDYTVSINPADGIATVTPTGSIVAADVWRLKGNIVLERLTDYQQRGGGQTNQINDDFDRLWIALQEFARDFGDAQIAPQTLPLSLGNGGTGASYASLGDLTIAMAASNAQFVAQSASNVVLVPSNLAARPRFHAHKNASDQGSITSATEITVTFGTEVFDIGGYYASNAWTPPAGLVVLIARLTYTNANAVDNEQLDVRILKNGTLYKRNFCTRGSTVSDGGLLIVIDAASGTDAYTVAANKGGAGTGALSGQIYDTFFQGFSV
jgi:hypothetical protein